MMQAYNQLVSYDIFTCFIIYEEKPIIFYHFLNMYIFSTFDINRIFYSLFIRKKTNKKTDSVLEKIAASDFF